MKRAPDRWWSHLLGRMAPGEAAAPASRQDPYALRQQARETARQRIRVTAMAVSAGLALVGVRTAWLMLVPDERLEDKARSLYHDTVVLEARRGDLLDRAGGVLATSVDMPALHADPARISAAEAPALASALAEVLGADPGRILERITRANARDVMLARDLTPDVARRARALGPGGRLFLRDQSRRYLPEGDMAAALFGVVGNTGSGREGLERSLDEYLRGDTFQFVRTRDREGRGLQAAAAALQAAHRGDDVVLTIDRTIQFAAERALDGVMERSAPASASLVALDVATGEVLAVANRPSTDPNDRDGVDTAGLRNHAVADELEPGSVFKPFIVALALEHGVVTPQDTIDCEGGTWHVGRSRIRDDHPHGVVSIGEVVKYSSNIGAAKLALRLGPEVALAGLRDFGFGRSPGSRIRGALGGFLRSPEHVRPIELATTAYGQGVTATTLQLASAVAAIAHGGVRMIPNVVREVRSPAGDVVLSVEPEIDRRVISEQAAFDVTRMMVTVTETGGTGTRAAVKGYAVAGKTGTAWKVIDGHYSSTARISSFIGFLPADRPRVAIAVVVDTPTQGSRYGGIAAAPAFREVAEVAMRHLGVPPDPPPPPDPVAEGVALAAAPPEPDGEPDGEPAPRGLTRGGTPWAVRPLEERDMALLWSDGGRLRVPDLTGLALRDVLVLFQGSGLAMSVRGHGRAVAQVPAAGAALAPGERVEVTFQ